MNQVVKNRAEIIAVGNEILLGDVINTNATYLSEQLWELGFEVQWHTVVPDDRKIMTEAFSLAADRADLVLVTGGLGPTIDDFTLAVFAELKSLPLKLDEESLRILKERFEHLDKVFTENQREQAMLPEGSQVLFNPVGTAPGVHDIYQKTHFFFFPGVPRELKQMYKRSAIPIIKKEFEFNLFRLRKTFRCFGATEGRLDQAIRPLLAGKSFREIDFAFQVKLPEVWLKLRCEAQSLQQAQELMSQAEESLRQAVGPYIISDDHRDLADLIVEELSKRNQTLALAESCTGGYVASWLVSVPGASQCLLESVVTYANQSKVKRLGVRESSLEAYGAVSSEIALEMAYGVWKSSGADFGIALTGIAGPGGGSEEKPVGTVHIALVGENIEWEKKCFFPMGRDNFKKLAAAAALDKLRRILVS